MSNLHETKIIILGGGYAGAVAALNLGRKTRNESVRITLVNSADHFVERIRLHQRAADQPLNRYPYPEFLDGTGVCFVHGLVTDLSTTQQKITLHTDVGTTQLGYDYLIYALGSTVDIDRVPGCAQYAMSLSSEGTAKTLQQQLPGVADRRGRLLVCGGGLTGIESASEFAEAYPDLRVILVTSGTLGEHLSAVGQRHLWRVFDRLGIEVMEDQTVTRIHAQRAECGGQREIPFDMCLWAGSFVVSPMARQAGLPVNEEGQIIVDGFLRAKGLPNVYAIGDAASLEQALDIPIRMACATAVPMGAYAGNHLAGMIRGQKRPRPYRFRYFMRCISLGRRDGLIQFVSADDTAKERVLTGRLAARWKELVCRSTIWNMQVLQRVTSWLGRTNDESPVVQEFARRRVV